MRAYKIILIVIILLTIKNSALAQYHNWFRFTLSNGAYSDESVIRFMASATDSFDYNFDAYKINNMGNTPNVYTKLGSNNYSINSLPDSFKIYELILYTKVSFNGIYNLKFEELKATDSLCSVLLIDNLLKTSQDLKVNPNYTFNCEVGAPSDRFVIHMEKQILNKLINEQNNTNIKPDSASVPVALNNSPLKVTSNGEILTIEMEEIASEVVISLNDLSGREVFFTKLNPVSEIVEIHVPSRGFQVIKVTADKVHYNGKIYLESF
jgi:hypothetical protein